MADSFLGDIAQTLGSTVGGVAGAGGIADALSKVTDSLQMQEMQDALHQLEITAAGLSEAAHDQVMEALPDLEVTNSTDLEAQGNQLIQDASDADAHRVQAEALQLEQAKAAESGDYDRAQELAVQAGYDLQAADALGRESSTQVVEAQTEQAALDQADWHQEIAVDNATSAAAYAETGDLDTAAIYGDVAADHGSTSADYGAAGDHGGSYAAPAADTSAAASSSVADTSSE